MTPDWHGMILGASDILGMVDESTKRVHRIGFWPDYSADNPYQRLFYESLVPWGMESTAEIGLNCQWLKDHADQLDVVHIHWPEKLWNSGKSLLDKLRLIRARCDFLRECRDRGILRVWTLHNWVPHRNGTWIDRLGNFAVAWNSDLILVHSESVRRKVARRWGLGRKVLVMPSGNYRGVYPEPRSSAEVRKELGFDVDKPLCAMLGHLRSNKGIAEVVEASKRLGDRYQWLIGGHVDDEETKSLLADWRHREGVRVIDVRLDDQEFADYSNAADCLLLPYHRSTGSGAMLAALTFGRGLVASRIPVFEELIDDEPNAAEFVRPKDPASLTDGIEAFFQNDVTQRHAAAQRLARRYDWNEVIRPVAERLQVQLESRRAETAKRHPESPNPA